jgi:WD40 repeat protein
LQTLQSQSFQDQRRAALAVAFSSDGALLASSGDDGRIVVRGTDGWNVQNTLETGATDLISIAFDGPGKNVASASLAGPVEIWALGREAGAHPVARIPARTEKRWKVRYSPDGSTIAVASWDGTVEFWDAETLQYRGTIDGNDERVNDIAFDGEHRLLTAAESGAVRLWDAAAIKPIFIDTLNDSRETLVGRYSPDGTKFAAGGKDGVATLYRVGEDGSLQRVCNVKHDNWVTSIAFSPDGGHVVSGDGSENGVKLWGTDNCQMVGRPIPAESADFRTVAFSPTGDRIAWSAKAGTIWLMFLKSDSPPIKLPTLHTNDVEEIDFNDTGTLLVSGGADGKVLLWNAADGSLDRQLRDGGSGIFTTRFGAGGRLVAAGGVSDEIQVWDLTRPKDQELIEVLPALGGSNRLAFDKDGTTLAVGSDARYISMWSTSSWDKIFQLNVAVGVRSVFGFDPTRGDLAFDGENGAIRVLPGRESPKLIYPTALRRGMDIFFDELPVNFALAQDTVTIESAPKSCETASR